MSGLDDLDEDPVPVDDAPLEEAADERTEPPLAPVPSEPDDLTLDEPVWNDDGPVRLRAELEAGDHDGEAVMVKLKCEGEVRAQR
jgi:hypothetical protein